MKPRSKPSIIISSNDKVKHNVNNCPPLLYHNLTALVPELLSIFCIKDDEC